MQFYTCADLMEKFQLSRSTIFRCIENQGFPEPYRIGKLLRWEKEPVDEWADKQVSQALKRTKQNEREVRKIEKQKEKEIEKLKKQLKKKTKVVRRPAKENKKRALTKKKNKKRSITKKRN